MEDFDGWEVLPDDGFLQIHDDGGKRIYSRSYGPGSRCVYKDYFICPDSKSTKFVENTEQEEEEEQYPRSRVVSIQLENSPDHNQEDLKKITEAPFEKIINQSLPLLLENLKEAEESDPDPVLQFLLKKTKEPEFVDMKKLESPTRSMKPPPFPVDSGTAAFQSLDEGKGESFDMKISSPNSLMKVEEEKIIFHSVSENNNGGCGFNIWKWSLTTGIGAICSFGIATATVCIIFFGTHQRNNTKQQQSKEKRKLQFHIYTDEKKLKEAAMRGSGRAHTTFGGGYYDELFE